MFTTTVMPIAASLAQSESKKRFFDRLGLDEGKKSHRQLYASMKGEAVEGWCRISAKREALIPQLRDDPSVEPPYTFGQIDEEAVHNEILYIYHHARPDTRIMYELGRDKDDEHEENWIIRWLLWHVFRYRDDRNTNPNRKRGQGDGGEESEATISDLAPDVDSTKIETPDQASNQIVAATTHIPLGEETVLRQHSVFESQSRFFDPVRDLFRT